MVAVDASSILIRLAHDDDGGANAAYARSDAAALPFTAESFDLVVFYNSLMDFDDMEGSLREAARVLRPKGKLCACVTHPLADAGRFESSEANATFMIEGAYLGPRRWVDIAAERDGLSMNFAGWAYPLEGYFSALEQAGLAVEAVREPSGGKTPDDKRWHRIPLFLMWRAVKA